MVSFSYSRFREHLNQSLQKSELQFIIRTFSGASLFFLCFAIICGTLNSIVTSLLGVNWFVSLAFTIIGFVSYFPLSYFALKYRNNPLRVPNSFVSTSFSLLSVSFMFLFLGVTNSFTAMMKTTWTSIDIWWSILFIFGISFFIYLVPVVIGLFVSKKHVITLNKFLNTCYVSYIFLFLISLIVALFGVGLNKFFHILLFLVVSAMLFVSPIITIYRLKTIAPYINYEDSAERRRWQNFFIFEISFQLLQLAFYIFKIVIYFMSQGRSRLRT